MSDALLAKATDIHQAGTAAFQSGTASLFTGFESGIANRYMASVRFKPGSEWELRLRVLQPLLDLETRVSDFKLFLALRDYPLHATVMEGRYDGAEFRERDAIFAAIARDARIWALRQALCNTEISLRYLCLDKSGNLILAAQAIPPRVAEAREALAQIYTEHRLTPLMITDLLHVTVGRVKALGSPRRPDDNLLEVVYNLRREILGEPVKMVVGPDMPIGLNSLEFLT